MGKSDEIFFEEIEPEVLDRMPEWFKKLREEVRQRSNKVFM
jgi:hypothetical protein